MSLVDTCLIAERLSEMASFTNCNFPLEVRKLVMYYRDVACKFLHVYIWLTQALLLCLHVMYLKFCVELTHLLPYWFKYELNLMPGTVILCVGVVHENWNYILKSDKKSHCMCNLSVITRVLIIFCIKSALQ